MRSTKTILVDSVENKIDREVYNGCFYTHAALQAEREVVFKVVRWFPEDILDIIVNDYEERGDLSI